MTATSETAPVVIKGPAWTGPMVAACGLSAIIVGAVLVVEHLGLAAAGLAVVGCATLALGVRMIQRPTTLTLSPDGLALTNLGIRRSWLWRNVDSFQTSRVRSGMVILFYDYTSKSQGVQHGLPSRWDRPVDEVVDLLQKAQVRWAK